MLKCSTLQSLLLTRVRIKGNATGGGGGGGGCSQPKLLYKRMVRERRVGWGEGGRGTFVNFR